MSEVQVCRCATLNALSGPSASDYARRHLDVTREVVGRTTTYRCAETGIEWVEERTPTPFNDDTRRLRRLGS